MASTPYSKTIPYMAVTFRWNGNDYPFGTFDSATLTLAKIRGKTFAMDGTTNGVTTLINGNQSDTLVITTTVAEFDFCSVLQKFYISGSRENCAVILTHKENPNIQTVLDNATITTNIFQTTYDENWGSYYSFEFQGKFTNVSEGNTEEI